VDFSPVTIAMIKPDFYQSTVGPFASIFA